MSKKYLDLEGLSHLIDNFEKELADSNAPIEEELIIGLFGDSPVVDDTDDTEDGEFENVVAQFEDIYTNQVGFTSDYTKTV